jgi:hypothetical protein
MGGRKALRTVVPAGLSQRTGRPGRAPPRKDVRRFPHPSGGRAFHRPFPVVGDRRYRGQCRFLRRNGHRARCGGRRRSGDRPESTTDSRGRGDRRQGARCAVFSTARPNCWHLGALLRVDEMSTVPREDHEVAGFSCPVAQGAEVAVRGEPQTGERGAGPVDRVRVLGDELVPGQCREDAMGAGATWCRAVRATATGSAAIVAGWSTTISGGRGWRACRTAPAASGRWWAAAPHAACFRGGPDCRGLRQPGYQRLTGDDSWSFRELS